LAIKAFIIWRVGRSVQGGSTKRTEWLRDGDPSLNGLLSPLLREAWLRGEVRVVCEVLPHRYLDLTTTIGTA
jgi:hypothetical protein